MAEWSLLILNWSFRKNDDGGLVHVHGWNVTNNAVSVTLVGIPCWFGDLPFYACIEDSIYTYRGEKGTAL